MGPTSHPEASPSKRACHSPRRYEVGGILSLGYKNTSFHLLISGFLSPPPPPYDVIVRVTQAIAPACAAKGPPLG